MIITQATDIFATLLHNKISNKFQKHFGKPFGNLPNEQIENNKCNLTFNPKEKRSEIWINKKIVSYSHICKFRLTCCFNCYINISLTEKMV